MDLLGWSALWPSLLPWPGCALGWGSFQLFLFLFFPNNYSASFFSLFLRLPYNVNHYIYRLKLKLSILKNSFFLLFLTVLWQWWAFWAWTHLNSFSASGLQSISNDSINSTLDSSFSLRTSLPQAMTGSDSQRAWLWARTGKPALCGYINTDKPTGQE